MGQVIKNAVLETRKNGDQVVVMPVTALRNILDNADIKESAAGEDYIPIIDSSDDGRMKKIPFSLIGSTAGSMTRFWERRDTPPSDERLIWIDSGNSNLAKICIDGVWTPMVGAWG